jgi:hypothetical protein
LPAAATTSNAETPSKPVSLQPRSAAIPFLNKAISQIEGEDGWVPLGQVGTQLSNLFSDFDVRSYGHSKLSDLVRKTEAFDVERIDSAHLRIRAKATAKAASSAPKGKAAKQAPPGRA